MKSLDEIMGNYTPVDEQTVNGKETVNSIDKSINTVNSNNSYTVDKVDPIPEDDTPESEGAAEMIAEMLDDKKSIEYYKLLVRKHGSTRLLDFAHYVKETSKMKQVRNKAVYFIAILRNKGMQTKFRKDGR